MSEIVTLDVGGTIFKTRRDTLKKMPMIDKMLDFPSKKIEETLFLDRDPKIFEILLGLARGWPLSSIEYLPDFQQHILRIEGDYLQMDIFQLSQNFRFKFAQSNEHATITNDMTVYTMGKLEKMNSILGDKELPSAGRIYWEVDIVQQGTNHDYICVGVAEPGMNPDVCAGASREFSGWKSESGHSFVKIRGTDAHKDVLPTFKTGMVIGVDVDMVLGTLSFWADGVFVAKTVNGFKGKRIYPAFSISGDAVMRLHSGVTPPQLVGPLSRP